MLLFVVLLFAAGCCSLRVVGCRSLLFVECLLLLFVVWMAVVGCNCLLCVGVLR